MEKETLIENKTKLESQLKSGVNWFFFIAVLSLVNSIISFFDGNMKFIVGLGIAQFIDALPGAFKFENPYLVKAIIIIINCIIAWIFIFIGILAGKRKIWVFTVGMILYFLDGLIFIAAKDYLSFGFHLLALFFIFRGMQAIKPLNEALTQADEISKTESKEEAK